MITLTRRNFQQNWFRWIQILLSSATCWILFWFIWCTQNGSYIKHAFKELKYTAFLPQKAHRLFTTSLTLKQAKYLLWFHGHIIIRQKGRNFWNVKTHFTFWTMFHDWI